MAGYLRKWQGQFRVKADFDQATNDFPRDAEGNIDSSFDDFYIPCAKKDKIRHYEQRTLLYFCCSIGRFRNTLKKIYEDKIGDLEKFKTYTSKVDKNNKSLFTFDLEPMYEELKNKDIVSYIMEYEEEGEFRFNVDMMDYVADLVGAITKGASISPFSIKNLPSKKYIIPEEELMEYKQIIDKTNMNIISQLTKGFDKVIQKTMGNKYNLNYERKLSCLSGKEFVHSIGLFNTFLTFLKAGL